MVEYNLRLECRKILLALLLLCGTLLCHASVHVFADKSVFAEGRFVRVQIRESGVYKLTYTQLQAKGIDPENVRVFGYGGAVLDEDFTKAMPDDLPEIAVYDTGSAILFYAQGVTRWTYDAGLDMFVHTTNPYADYGCYFVTSDDIGERKRIVEQSPVTSGNAKLMTEFTDYAVHEEELYSPVKAGRELYGEKLAVGDRLDVSFDFPNMLSETNMRVRLDVINNSTKTVDGNGKVTKNNVSTFSLTHGSLSHKLQVDGRYNYDIVTPRDTCFSYNSNGEEHLAFSLGFSNDKEATATGYLNFLEINVRRKLALEGAFMMFHNKDIASATYNRYQLQANGSRNVCVWDVTDPQQVQQLSAQHTGQAVEFTDEASRVKSYVAIDLESVDDIPSASLQDEVPNQNLHAMGPTDMLIITHENFKSEAERLAQAHAEYNNGLKVSVVTANEVYNEFSSGTPDATAYRRVCKMLYDRYGNSTADKLKYLLLIGKGSFDNRGRLSASGDRFLLTFQASASTNSTKAYATDDYFGLLDDKEGTSIGGKDRIDIGIGRFPVRTADEAKNVVDKTIRYMKGEDYGSWRNQLCFIGDDGDSGSHMRQVDGFADNINRAYPGFKINKILLDAYQYDGQGGGYPTAKRHFQDLMASGLLLVNYMGHGTVNGWGDILNLSEIQSFDNAYYPLFVSGTCEFSRFDREYITAGEALLKNPQGGAIGVFSATRTVYQNYNETIVKHFLDSVVALSKKNHLTVGDAVRQAKNVSFGDMNRIGPNTLSYVYFGDPAVRLHYPTDFSVRVVDLTDRQGNDTLKAMSVATLKGFIADVQGEQRNDFNGEVEITLQDKEERRKTLANGSNTPYSYKDRTVVSIGKAKVKDGEFEYTFMLPKDIKYNYGKGNFIFYALDSVRGEAQGYFNDFIIGGYNEDFVDDTTGPDVSLYLNDETFVSGDVVNEEPVFFADLYDPNGISLYSVTPGHDLMLCLDNEYWYPLGEHYETLSGDYRTGSVMYPLPEQAEGKHVLMLRAWDLLGNSTVKTLEYEVVAGRKEPSGFSVLCYPNPVKSIANIRITYPESNEVERVTLDIFDLSGRRIWTQEQDGLDAVSWNVLNSEGGVAPEGVYVLRTSVYTKSGTVLTESYKIMVQ